MHLFIPDTSAMRSAGSFVPLLTRFSRRASRSTSVCVLSSSVLSPDGLASSAISDHQRIFFREGLMKSPLGVPAQLRPMAAASLSDESSMRLPESQGGSRVGATDEFETREYAMHRSPSEDDDTIAAIVTGPQQAAVAIIRLSGPQAVAIAAEVFKCRGKKARDTIWQPATHHVYYGHAADSEGQILDEVLAIAMLAPRSYTAETVVEIHTHGGAVPARRVLAALLQAGARLAGPGEFTLRAFLNGRLDLSQAEAVGQLITARTSAAADTALAGLGGGLASAISEARSEIIQVLAEVEARLDFDEDLPPLDTAAVYKRIVDVVSSVQGAVATARQGQLLHHGLRVALVGRPNVGKSSLLNAWSGTQRSIVTNVAGTTRDIVEAGVTLGGIPVTLLDTAGLREAVDAAEAIGVERSSAAARAADIVLMVIDAQEGWTPEDEAVLQQLRPPSLPPSAPASPLLLVVNKVDDTLPTVTSNHQTPRPPHHSVAVPLPSIASSTVQPAPTESAPAASTLPGDCDSQTIQLKLSSNACVASIPESVTARVSNAVAASAMTAGGLDDLKSIVLAMTDAADIATGGKQWAVNERQAEALLRALESLER